MEAGNRSEGWGGGGGGAGGKAREKTVRCGGGVWD